MSIEALTQRLPSNIQTLNLSLVKKKLVDPEEGAGWTPEQCDVVETEYRRFLTLKLEYPQLDIVPNRSVDRFWHQHILDTRAYAEDCQRLFAGFLHHYPYFGMEGDDDRSALATAFDVTSSLYERRFGESYASVAARCRTACKPQKCK